MQTAFLVYESMMLQVCQRGRGSSVGDGKDVPADGKDAPAFTGTSLVKWTQIWRVRLGCPVRRRPNPPLRKAQQLDLDARLPFGSWVRLPASS